MVLRELSGVLQANSLTAANTEGRVVMSAFSRGASPCTAAPGLGIKYVAQGAEVYRFAGKTYVVSARQFLLVPCGLAGEVEIRQPLNDDAVGMCLFLPEAQTDMPKDLGRPMLFPAQCSDLGRLLQHSHRQIWRSTKRPALAAELLGAATTHIASLVDEARVMADSVDGARPSTRYDLLRRLNVARSYLHDVTDRAVGLEELARISGTSRFHLLRNFQASFGLAPASYHRRLRIELALGAMQSSRLSCTDAAHRFGFADASSFSHACRRALGHSPKRRVGKAATDGKASPGERA